jgi:hypothetical protein
MRESTEALLRRPATWPRPVRLAFQSILAVFANAYLAARSNAAGSPSKTVRLLAEITDLKFRNALLERELAVQRRRIESICPGSQFKWNFLTPFCVSPPAAIAS